MEEANCKASEAVFQANNLSSDADVIDLHGLYVKEAEKVQASQAWLQGDPHCPSLTGTRRVQVTSARIDQAIAGRRMHLVVIVGQVSFELTRVSQLLPAVVHLEVTVTSNVALSRVTTVRTESSTSSLPSRPWPSKEACPAQTGSPGRAACGWTCHSRLCCGPWQPYCAALYLVCEVPATL